MDLKTTTPDCVTDEIIKFCSEITITTVPRYVPVYPQKHCQHNECFPNVDHIIKKHGGKRILGWSIWKWPNILIEAEAHAIWKNSIGEYIDVTPHNGEQRILFLEDDSLVYEGNPIGNKRKALTNSPLVAELIEIANEKDEIMCNISGNTFSLPTSMIHRQLELELIFRQKVGRNDLCPCQSGLKYKKCCGVNA